MVFHILTLPHTELDERSIACAYSMKIVKFCKMMSKRGHDCVTYGGAVAPPHVKEHVQVVDIPPIDHNRLYDVDWVRDFVEYDQKVIPEIRERMSDKDFLCITAGTSHQPVADAIPELMAVETGIGYEGTFAKYRVFESYAWMHTVYAQQHTVNGLFYDAVIPNFFDPADFPQIPTKPRDHLVWMGRFVERKGPHVAYQIAQACGRQLIMGGQGVLENSPGKIVGAELTIEGPDFAHVGPLDKRKRSSFLATAHALLMPTIYIEPFGGVAVEALMCGTPVITTDWGAFTEFVIPHWNGTRFHTLREAVEGVNEATYLDRKWIQDAARKRFSLEAVGKQYEEYFARLLDLWGAGWGTL